MNLLTFHNAGTELILPSRNEDFSFFSHICKEDDLQGRSLGGWARFKIYAHLTCPPGMSSHCLASPLNAGATTNFRRISCNHYSHINCSESLIYQGKCKSLLKTH
jgi:hypothetical protein